jgi:hypothetical protein
VVVKSLASLDFDPSDLRKAASLERGLVEVNQEYCPLDGDIGTVPGKPLIRLVV